MAGSGADPGPVPAELWTAAEVAAFLKVSRSWVYDAAGRGQLPHFRLGRVLRFDPRDVRRLVDRKEGGDG